MRVKQHHESKVKSRICIQVVRHTKSTPCSKYVKWSLSLAFNFSKTIAMPSLSCVLKCREWCHLSHFWTAHNFWVITRFPNESVLKLGGEQVAISLDCELKSWQRNRFQLQRKETSENSGHILVPELRVGCSCGVQLRPDTFHALDWRLLLPCNSTPPQ